MTNCPYISLISTFENSLANVTRRLENNIVPECYLEEEKQRQTKYINDIAYFRKSKIERDAWYLKRNRKVA
jgi:hypothetical protein